MHDSTKSLLPEAFKLKQCLTNKFTSIPAIFPVFAHFQAGVLSSYKNLLFREAYLKILTFLFFFFCLLIASVTVCTRSPEDKIAEPQLVMHYCEAAELHMI